jgi:hypothetical protein
LSQLGIGITGIYFHQGVGAGVGGAGVGLGGTGGTGFDTGFPPGRVCGCCMLSSISLSIASRSFSVGVIGGQDGFGSLFSLSLYLNINPSCGLGQESRVE